MLNLIVFGAPGSGKGTQSALIKEHYDLVHISTGDVLRQEIRANTPLGELAKKYIDQGLLVPDDVIIEMLEHLLETTQNPKGYIFDGFPRTVVQAEALVEMLSRHGMKIDALIDLKVPTPELKARLLKRGEISGRSDDNIEAIEKRLSVYQSQTAPVIEYFKEHGVYAEIDGVGTIEKTNSRIQAAIDRQTQQ